MEANSRPRKSCDLCYTRKLKCNGRRPRCSNCIIYSEDCTHTAVSRKWRPKEQRKDIKGADEKTDEIRSLQAQVQQLKAQLAQHSVNDQAQDRTTDDHENVLEPMRLPPLQQALPLIEAFLNSFNSVLPLFSADTLWRLVGECYALQPAQRDPVAWAAINTVLALACQQVPGGSDGDGSAGSRAEQTTEYLNNAQSVISTLMLGATRLLGIQTLVGIAMVFMGAQDLTPALILISTTMRLAHKMGLHDRAASAHLDRSERRQRAHVFWLAYILDKDLSLRAQQPSIQLDDDIDLALPSALRQENQADGETIGIVSTTNGNARMNYFLVRVQLASIEGRIYDCLYSTRALNRRAEERSVARESIVNDLREWRAAIPPEFGADVVAWTASSNPANIGFFCLLHATSLQCMALINKAHAWDEKWVSGLRDHGRETRALQLPPGWGALVHQARDFMVLFGEAWPKDVWFRWLVSCPYISAMVLLMANNLSNLHHDNIQPDSQLVDTALLWLNEAVNETQKEDARIPRNVCVEVIGVVRQKRAEAAATTPGNGLFLDFPEIE